MSKDVLMSLCKDIVKMNVRAVNWTGGGEPTVNSNLKYAIEYLGKHNVKMGMFTNGTLLDRFNLFEERSSLIFLWAVINSKIAFSFIMQSAFKFIT